MKPTTPFQPPSDVWLKVTPVLAVPLTVIEGPLAETTIVEALTTMTGPPVTDEPT